MTQKKWMAILLVVMICLPLAGCSAAQKQKIDETDRWIRENLW